MRIFMRIFLTVYILCVLFIAGVILACAWGIIDVSHPYYWLTQLYQDTTVIVVVSIIGVLVVLLSLVLLFTRSKKRGPKAALIIRTPNGGISITLSAIEEMAMRHILANTAVRSAKVRVGVKENKVKLTSNVTVAEETNIPGTLQDLQASLKVHIETLCGIEVDDITLLVEKTAQVAKARVE